MNIKKHVLSPEDLEVNRTWQTYLKIFPHYFLFMALGLLGLFKFDRYVAFFVLGLTLMIHGMYFFAFIIRGGDVLRNFKFHKSRKKMLIFFLILALLTYILGLLPIKLTEDILFYMISILFCFPYPLFTVYIYLNLKKYWKSRGLQSSWLALLNQKINCILVIYGYTTTK